jgi:BirA family biotin operon repressor/biotin-[acetyl-CoA-carboxylase] ligase
MSPDLRAPIVGSYLAKATPWGELVAVVGETTSTNDEMLRFGEGEASSGTILFAETQSAGRGQFGRPWASANGLGLWFSILLRMEINDRVIPALSQFAAVAIIDALRSLGVNPVGIKAPNDVLIGELKVAGILVETRVGKNPFAVVGVGLNVNQRRDDFPPEIRSRAVSLSMVSGKDWNRTELAATLLRELWQKHRLMINSPTELHNAWEKMLLTPVDEV